MKNLTKAINRLSKAIEIQNKQLQELRSANNNKLADTLGMSMLAIMMNNNPFAMQSKNNQGTTNQNV